MFQKKGDVVTAVLPIQYEMQRCTVTIQYNTATGESVIHTAYDPDPACMPYREAIPFLQKLMFQQRLLLAEEPKNACDTYESWLERCRQLEQLIGEVKARLTRCLEEARAWNLKMLFRLPSGGDCNLLFCDGENTYRLPELAEVCPALGLMWWTDSPMIYWYIHECFPRDLRLPDIMGLRRIQKRRLKRMRIWFPKDALWAYRLSLKERQLNQLQEMARTRLLTEGMDPGEKEMDFPEWVRFLEKLEYGLMCLKLVEPQEQGAEHLRWQEGCEEFGRRIHRTKQRLKVCLEGAQTGNCAQQLSALDAFLLYWYVYERFPEDMDGESMHDLLHALMGHCVGRYESDDFLRFQHYVEKEQIRQLKDALDKRGLGETYAPDATPWQGEVPKIFARNRGLVTVSFPFYFEMQEGTVTIDSDPVSGCRIVAISIYPDPRKLSWRELVNLMNRLEVRRQSLLSAVPDQGGDQRLIWEVRWGRLEQLMEQVRQELEKYRENDFVYWSLYGRFPENLDIHSLRKLYEYLQGRLQIQRQNKPENPEAHWLYQWAQTEQQIQEVRRRLGKYSLRNGDSP